jgi:hypothetical protein
MLSARGLVLGQPAGGRRWLQGLDGKPRRVIVVFNHELDIELATRIVDGVERGNELRDDARFLMQRDDD